jgi:uncharacterized protein (TIGR02757 family)
MSLRGFLDQLHSRYHRPGFLDSDPLEFVHRYADPWDQEAVALLAAVLAYGNVKQIRRSVADALNRIETVSAGPAAFVRGLAGDARRREALTGFVHRFNRGADVALLLELLERSWRSHGSLGAHFVSHLAPEAPDIGPALGALIADWRRWAGKRGGGSFEYLLTSPEQGSVCKRWCMFLRWMWRRDALDPGLWTEAGALRGTFPPGRFVRASQLVIPLDTHTGRISQYLALTSRKSLNWQASLEVTARLRECDPRDPVRYDFALARLGILDLCQRRFQMKICQGCDLLPVCRFAQKELSSSRPASTRSAR